MSLSPRSLGLLVLGSLTAATPVVAQEVCPRASGPDAEAGWTAYSANDVGEARARFAAALARCDDDHYARTGMGYVLLREGAVDEAIAAWSEVVGSQPDNVDALTGLGLAEWRKGNVQAVRAHFVRVVQLDPGNATARDYLERLSATPATTSGPSDAADRAWTEGNSALALELYTARLQADPTDETALLRSGLLTAWQGRYAEARALLDRLIERSPRDLDARLARARVRAWSGDVSGAQGEVREILAVQPDNREALEALALFQAWTGELDEALGTYDELLAIAPESSVASRMRAQALARASRFEASRAAYEALLAADPTDVEARLGLAEALAYGQDLNASLAEYDRVLATSPADVRALVGKSRVLTWAGRLVEAERVARMATEADGESAAAWTGLGQIYRAQGRPAEAIAALETATRIAPTDPDARDQLRSVRLSLAPIAQPTVIYERDSDDNRILTTMLTSGWHPTPRLDVRARAFYRDLDQRIFLRNAQGVTLTSSYQLTPGWTIVAGLGGSRTNGTTTPTLLEYQVSVRTPERHTLGAGVHYASTGVNETASLAELGGRSNELSLSARWSVSPTWRVDGSVGVGEIQGREDNGRRSALLSTSRRFGSLAVGLSLRGFSFEKDLDDGYFDPDFYGVGELTSAWSHRTGSWSVLAELAPGVQKVRRDGDVGSSLRANARVAYQIGAGREVSLSLGHSTAGLVSFATDTGGYRYTAIILGMSWAF
jgi:tetratricopeptide (TPR) repeat protein